MGLRQAGGCHADAAGEVAYTSAVFSPRISFATGWMMTLAYSSSAPGSRRGWPHRRLHPSSSIRSNSIASPAAGVFAASCHGLSLTALLHVLNYRGIRLSATFNWTSFGTLACLSCLWLSA